MTTINLRDDAVTVRAALDRRVREFLDQNSDKAPSPVTCVEVGYCFVQCGYFFINFDQRVLHDRDGQWTVRIKDETEMPHWQQFAEKGFDDDHVITLPDGKQTDVWSEQKFSQSIAEMIAGAIRQAASEGVFDTLPKAPQCQIDVEDFEGLGAWPPSYDSLGRDNLL